MSANVIGKLTHQKRPRGRAALALLPGVFALMLVGVSGVAAATPSQTPTRTAAAAKTHPKHCWHGTNPDGTCCPQSGCPTPTASPTSSPTSTPSPTSSPTGGGNNGNGGGSTPTPTATPTSTPAPTRTPAPTPTSKPVTTGGSGGGHSSGGGSGVRGSGGTTADGDVTHVQAQADPTPFAPLTSAVTVVTSGQGLDAARIPPVEALTPLSGLEFGSGLNLGPLLLLIDMIGIGLLVYLVRTRWLAPEA
jgi:hypothetical protein